MVLPSLAYAAARYAPPPPLRGSSMTHGRYAVLYAAADASGDPRLVGVRFWSLSRARRFARRVRGRVMRWRAHEWKPRQVWREVAEAARTERVGLWVDLAAFAGDMLAWIEGI